MKKLLLGLLVFVVLISGCTGANPSYSNEDLQDVQDQGSNSEEIQATVQSISIFMPMGESWDSDADVDGIEMSVEVKDVNDDTVEAEGTLTATLYYWECDYSMSPPCFKGNKIGTWSNVQITKDNYDFMGFKTRLNYDDIGFKALSSSGISSSRMGMIEITFTTPDGKTFSARDDSIFLDGI